MAKKYFEAFFHPEKSPRTQITRNKTTGLLEFDYVPKHQKRQGVVVWDSNRKGTYVRQK